MRRFVPDSLFGRLLAAMLAAIGVTFVIIVALLLQERRDTLFSGSETAAVVTAIADAAESLAALPRPSARRRSSACSASRLRVAGRFQPPRPGSRSRRHARLGALAAVAARARARPRLRACASHPRARALPTSYDRRWRASGSGRSRRHVASEFGAGGPEPRGDRFRGRGGPGGAAARARHRCHVARRRRRHVPHESRRRRRRRCRCRCCSSSASSRSCSVSFCMPWRARSRGRSPSSRPQQKELAAARACRCGKRGARELREATRAFNTMQERLHRYLDSRTRVLSAMSHDLRTPLTRLKLRTESLDDAALRERFNADLDEMQRMVTGALNLFRGMNHDEPLQTVDVGALVAELKREQAELGTEVEVTGTAAPVSARPTALKRCLGNLLVERGQVRHESGRCAGRRARRARRSHPRRWARHSPGDARASIRAVLQARELAQRRHRRRGARLIHCARRRASARRFADAAQPLAARPRSCPAATEKSQSTADRFIHRAFSSIQRRSCFVRLRVCILRRIARVIRLELFQRLPRICR